MVLAVVALEHTVSTSGLGVYLRQSLTFLVLA